MATMTTYEQTGAREFRVPFAAKLPGAPFEGPGEIVIATEPPDDRPAKVAFRFTLDETDTKIRLPRALKGTPWADRGLTLVNQAARGGRLVVTYDAGGALLAKLTGGLASLEAIAGYLLEAPDLFDFGAYALESVAVES